MVDRTSAIADIVASPCDLNLSRQYNNLFDGVATQMRWFYVIRRRAFLSRIFALQRIAAQNCLNGGVVLPL
jgi:hypothetical protein